MLVPLNKIDCFICPKTGSNLSRVGNHLVDSEGFTKYDIINGKPVLIDFESSVLRSIDFNNLDIPALVKRNSYSGLLNLLKRIVAPMQLVTRENVKQFLNQLNAKEGRQKVLVIGGGSIGEGMNPIYDNPNIDLYSFDIYNSEIIQFVADAHQIPIKDTYFDAIVVQAVLEHVLRPDIVVEEIYRLLKNDGLVYAETPFLQNVHEGAYDFTRFTESGHRYLFRKFKAINSGVTSGAGTQMLWSIDNLFRGIFRSRLAGKIAKTAFFWIQYADRIIPEKYNIDSACGVFFMGQKSPTTITPKDAIKHYKGAQK